MCCDSKKYKNETNYCSLPNPDRFIQWYIYVYIYYFKCIYLYYYILYIYTDNYQKNLFIYLLDGSMSTKGSSTFVINPDIPEATRLKSWYLKNLKTLRIYLKKKRILHFNLQYFCILQVCR